ncbi:MAG: sulfite exporter TauE/SafE family protein [Verrucomicrobiota bacterium]
MSLSEHWWIFILIGVASGLLSGTLGVGAGIIMVPTLVVFFTHPQKDAQAISLAVMVPMALMGAWRYQRNPEIALDFRMAGLIAVGALAGVIGGAYLAGILPAAALRKIFAVFMIVAAVRMLLVK